MTNRYWEKENFTKRLKRLCRECGEMFIPDGKYAVLCRECRREAYDRGLRTRMSRAVA